MPVSNADTIFLKFGLVEIGATGFTGVVAVVALALLFVGMRLMRHHF